MTTLKTPWVGAARRAAAEDFRHAAGGLGCSVEALRAVWEVEAAGRPFRSDGSLERRFEPHKLAKPAGDWRASLALPAAEREASFAAAFSRSADDAMRATSWGAPQIMGFNFAAAGFASPERMVEEMADDEGAQLRGFVALVRAWGLDGALRSHDWARFAARYNGNANVREYAARIESAFQRLSGTASPVILRSGDKGAAVRRLQAALGVPQDGSFGPETLRAVREFQRDAMLPVDGVVGARTWKALEKRRDAHPIRQPAEEDRVARAGQIASVAATGAGAVATIGKALPESSLNVLIIAMAVCALAALALFAFRKRRGVA